MLLVSENPIIMKAKAKAKLVRRAKGLSIAIMILGALMLAWNYSYVLSHFTCNTECDKIVWIEGHENWQIYNVVAYLALTTILYALGGVFLIRINKNISKGVPFPKNNVPVIIAAGILAPFVDSYHETLKSVFAGEHASSLSGTGIFAMLLLFLFAILYKFASLASEDSNLAI